MIISHKHNFIFVKNLKTAGTSLEIFLSTFCGTNDVITPFWFLPDEKLRIEHNSPQPKNYFVRKKWSSYNKRELYDLFWKRKFANSKIITEHSSLTEAKEFLAHKNFNSYIKVATIRNPWDQAVSYYKWSLHRGNTHSFEEFLMSYPADMWNKMVVDGKPEIDYIIRFENLYEDINLLLKRLNINTNTISLPYAKTGIRKKKSYNEMYDGFTKEIVYRRNKKLIDNYNYSFE